MDQPQFRELKLENCPLFAFRRYNYLTIKLYEVPDEGDATSGMSEAPI